MYDCGFTRDGHWFRYRAAAIIVEEGCVLFAGNEKEDYLYSVGGAVQMGETAEDAVRREVLEETGVAYEIDRLAVIHENFSHGGRRNACGPGLPRDLPLFPHEAPGLPGAPQPQLYLRRSRAYALDSHRGAGGIQGVPQLYAGLSPHRSPGRDAYRHPTSVYPGRYKPPPAVAGPPCTRRLAGRLWASAPTNGIAVSTVDGVHTPRRIRRSPERNAA